MKSGYINRTGLYRVEEFDVVHITVRPEARNVSIRWKGERLHISAPTGIEYDRLVEILRRAAPKIEHKRPESMYAIGRSWQFPHFKITLSSQSSHPRHVLFKRDGDHHILLNVGCDIDLGSPSGCEAVSRSICRVAQSYGHKLLARAREVAQIIGKSPLSWELSRGHRTLGHCSQRGVIALSYVLLLYPADVCDAVICHELAHLSEMNHSPRFHTVCDDYCRRVTGQGEKDLATLLKSHPIPIIK